jgi:hypothetical protein
MRFIATPKIAKESFEKILPIVKPMTARVLLQEILHTAKQNFVKHGLDTILIIALARLDTKIAWESLK